MAERQVADLTSLPELAGIGSQDGELAAILEGLSDAIARTWSDRTENSATAVSAALASVSTDFALVGLNAYSAANLLDGAGASAFNLSYDADVLNVDLTGFWSAKRQVSAPFGAKSRSLRKSVNVPRICRLARR